jgi:DNA mismatch endonuclease (patch repair protein)
MSSEKRSALMSRIRGKNTGIELLVFRELRRRGLHFTRHARDLPGRPDVVFRRARIAVFIDGDFWHGWRFPRWQHKLQPRWREKIAENRRRDQRNFARLRRSGWRVVRVWEHQLKRDPESAIRRIISARTQSDRKRRH